MGKRSLPTRHNPNLVEGKEVNYEELLSVRRLGQTNLTGTRRNRGNGEEPAVGVLNYSHLRVPLPQELANGEYQLFPNTVKGSPPEAYFLMRRSNDGFISATGMFKAAFPFATKKEEENERDYLKSDLSASGDEVAGNIWVAPERALALAKEYKITTWISALLDNSPIPITPADRIRKIEVPPPFHPPTESNTKQGRAHRHRTASPDLASSTAATAAVRKVLSPTKGRPRKAAAAAAQAAQAAESALTDGVTSASQSLKAAVSSAGQRAVTSLGDTLRHATSAVTPRSATDMQVRIQQDVSDAENHDGSAKTHTHVDISLPKGSGADALDLPGDVEGIMEKAKAAIEAGKAQVVRSEAGAGAGGGRGRKRKADELDRGQQQQKEGADEDEQEEGGDVERPRGKRARVDVEEELKVEKVKNRALLGLTGALALGTILPYLL